MPTREELQEVADHIFAHITGLFSVYIWAKKVGPLIPEEKFTQEYLGQSYLPMLNATLMDGHLINLRRLNEFFAPSTRRKGHSDDIRASDFGFSSSEPFLSDEDAERINKIVAHPTVRISERAQYSFHPFRQIERPMRVCFAYLSHLSIQFYGHNSPKGQQMERVSQMLRNLYQEWEAAVVERERTER